DASAVRRPRRDVATDRQCVRDRRRPGAGTDAVAAGEGPATGPGSAAARVAGVRAAAAPRRTGEGAFGGSRELRRADLRGAAVAGRRAALDERALRRVALRRPRAVVRGESAADRRTAGLPRPPPENVGAASAATGIAAGRPQPGGQWSARPAS